MNKIKILIGRLDSDSKKTATNAANELCSIARNHYDKIIEIHQKYKENKVNNSDYQVGRGYLEYEDIDGDTLWFRYIDSWRYGGSCNERIYININDLENYDYDALDETIKTKRILKLKQEIVGLELNIKNKQDEIDNYSKLELKIK